MEFGKIISTALRVTWREKKLWVFVIFPIVLSFVPTFFQPAIPRPSVELWTYVGLACGAAFVSFFAAPFLTGSLTIGLLRALANKKVDILSLLRESTSYYWRLFLLPLVGGIPLVLSYIVGLVALRGSAQSTMLLCLVCGLSIAFFVCAIFWGVVLAFAQVAVVEDDRKVADAIQKAWTTVKTNLNHVVASILVYGACVVALYILYFLGTSGLQALIPGRGQSINEALAFSQSWPVRTLLLAASSLFSVLSIAFYASWVQTYLALRTKNTKRTNKTARKKVTKKKKAATTIKKKRIR